MNRKFSVLMSIYYKERAEYFDRAMKSIWDEQTVKPNEIVLVQDGELTNELYDVINKWKNKLGKVLKIIEIEQNVGLGDALNKGLNACIHELVARMDTDDISLANRFEEQLNIFKKNDIDLCGSWISEFDNQEREIISYRKVPEKHFEIVEYSKMRNGINHPSVMYKKSVVKKSAGYQRMMYFEDYYLWSRMILTGAKFYNIQEALVNMRAGYRQLERRRGLRYAIEEYNFFKELKNIGFLSTLEFLRNIFIRLIIRVLPQSLLKKIYKKIRS